MAEPTPPKVVIVYVDDSLVQRDRVNSLSERLRREGFEARIDAWEPRDIRPGVPDRAAATNLWGVEPERFRWWSRGDESRGGERRRWEQVLLVLSDSWTRQFQDGNPRRELLDQLRAHDTQHWAVALSRRDARNCPADLLCLDLSREDGYWSLVQALTPASQNRLQLFEPSGVPLYGSEATAIWHVPFTRNLAFTDREDILDHLHRELTTGEAGRQVVLVGSAGVGKSQIALEYAYRHRSVHRSVLWIEATTRLSVDRGLREIATRLRPTIESESPDVVAETVADWLWDHPSSLLVFDGVDRLSAIPESFLRNAPCQVLMTSRARRVSNWGATALVVKVQGGREGPLWRSWLRVLASLLPRLLRSWARGPTFESIPSEPPSDSSADERDLCDSLPWGSALLERLRDDGASLLRIRPFGEGCWLLRVRLPETLQEAHGTAPDLLLLAACGEVRGAYLQRAQEELYRRDPDLDPDLLLIADGMPQLAERLERMFLIRSQWIPWSQAAGRFPPLAPEMRRHLPAYDIFEARDPVRGRQVVGRHDLVSDLSRRLLQGQAVGVFGLRKVGKTTLVRAVTDRLDPVSVGFSRSTSRPTDLNSEPSMARVIWLDLERIYECTLETVSEHLLQELERRLGGEGEVAAKPLSLGPFARLEALLSLALRRSDRPLVIVLDEYDLLFEGVSGQPAIPNIHRLFQLLRGYSQESGRLALVAIGREPESLQQPEMGGWPNPVLNWIIPRWLGPLGSIAASELLTGLGRRVLLDVGRETAELAGRWTGGHPLLHRQFGSALLALARQQGDWDRALETDPFCQRGVSEFLERDAVLGLCREVDHLLSSRYPEAGQLLKTLCHSPAESACTFLTREGCGSAQHTLKNFGLLLGNAERAWVPEVYRWYFQTFAPQLERRPA
jgi:hypothetical protein